MKHCILAGIFFLIIQYVHSANWNSIKAGNWNDATTWAENAVPATTGNIGTVAINHNVTLNQNATVSTLEVIAGTLLTSGANTLTATDLIVKNGATLHHNSTEARMLAITNFSVEDGGFYIHDAASHTSNGAVTDIPGSSAKTFGDLSTQEIRKWGNGGSSLVALPAVSTGWGNLVINVLVLAAAWNLNGSLSLIKGDFVLNRTGPSRELILFSRSSTNSTLTIKGNIILTPLGGSALKASVLQGNTLSMNKNITLTVEKNIEVNGGTLSLSSFITGFTGLSYIYINLKGDLIQRATGVIAQTKNLSVIVDLRFVGTNEQLIDIEDPISTFYAGINIGTSSINSQVTVVRNFVINNTTTTATALVVNNGSTLKIQGSNVISGNIVLQIKPAASIVIEHPAGLEPVNGTTGAVQINGTTPGFPPLYPSESTDYSSSANYIFTGGANQITGSGIPDDVLGSLIIDKSSGSAATLSKPVSISGTFNLKNGIVNTTVTNLLTIKSPGSLTGTFNNANFINGPVRRYLNPANTGDYVFPVGYHNGSIFNYKPIVFTPTSTVSASDYFDARFVPATSPTGELLGINMIGKLVPEYWELLPNSGVTTSGKVSVNYTWPGTAATNWINPAFANITPESNHYIAVAHFHDNGSSSYWDFTKAASQLMEKIYVPDASNDGLVQSGPLNNFGIFTFGLFYDNVLPIIIKDFRLSRTNGANQLKWHVEGENIIKDITLEISNNGIQFQPLQKLNTLTGSINAAPHAEGKYYRLKVQSKTGDNIYSKILYLSDNQGTKYNIINNGQSNPALQIALAESGTFQYRIISQQGTIMLIKKIDLLKGDHILTLHSNHLSKGVYYVQIQDNSQITNTLKLIVN
ncbi:autotransporter outer membrane beta-barrel domain-containing protein [Polluticaenibacter yanchengensis]|uniref:T9SS type A sorting domain-containing protein n=1 Tax=Polluticaenibacter yanchengensis TaxID=3014562 RepID=A0ABT4UL62_9BACT|nr:hypothetical protein [Chitinophagaceae bacterium LY-5]